MAVGAAAGRPERTVADQNDFVLKLLRFIIRVLLRMYLTFAKLVRQGIARHASAARAHLLLRGWTGERGVDLPL